MKNVNAEKNGLLREINRLDSALHESLIDYWGTRLFPILASEFLSKAKLKSAKHSTILSDLVIELANLHEAEFEELNLATECSINYELSSSPKFITINSKFPHIGKRLSATWGTKYFPLYTNILTAQSSEFKRLGLPGEIMAALLLLKKEHDDKYPEFVEKTNGLQWY